GLAAGFLEPLESTGIVQIEAAAILIAKYFPRHITDMEHVAKHFSMVMRRRFELAIDFVKLHYCLSKRTDHPFWIDNTKPETISDVLRERLEMWRWRPPEDLDFDIKYDAFAYQN